MKVYKIQNLNNNSPYRKRCGRAVRWMGYGATDAGGFYGSWLDHWRDYFAGSVREKPKIPKWCHGKPCRMERALQESNDIVLCAGCGTSGCFDAYGLFAWCSLYWIYRQWGSVHCGKCRAYGSAHAPLHQERNWYFKNKCRKRGEVKWGSMMSWTVWPVRTTRFWTRRWPTASISHVNYCTVSLSDIGACQSKQSGNLMKIE